ncbi:hypothetical protein HPB51_023925 [Rhipicephalus microplus]|uniref:Uncharacterized protein n=1 Tax=Rhipicephalus microplus TaxID=6941 RepID=A0A9J6DDJ5_RHIMP|nr:hypothetical protein HPB51_023925 [Rhipicephalus microplus]
MDREKFIALGRQLGLENEELREWVERECVEARDERAREREIAKENAERQQKLLEQQQKVQEQELKILELKLRLQESASREENGFPRIRDLRCPSRSPRRRRRSLQVAVSFVTRQAIAQPTAGPARKGILSADAEYANKVDTAVTDAPVENLVKTRHHVCYRKNAKT